MLRFGVSCGGVWRLKPKLARSVNRKPYPTAERHWTACTHKRNKQGTWRWENPDTRQLSEVFVDRLTCLEAAQTYLLITRGVAP